jgi:polysaccharide biosynthesis transport protein
MRFTQLLRILRAHFGLILLTLTCAWLVGGIVTALMPPKYVATSSVLINYADSAANAGAAPPAQIYSTYLATQIDLIASQNVATKVVDRLNLAGNPAARKRYLGDGSSLRDALSNLKTRVLTALNKSGEDDATHATRDPEGERYWLADQVLRRSTIRPSTDSSVIQVSYAATTAKAAAEVANAFVKAYIDTTLELNVNPARASSEWLDSQVARLTTNLEQARAKLTDFQQRAGIVSVGDTDDVETGRLNDLNSQLIAAQSQNHPGIQALKSDLMRAQAKMNELPAQIGDNHPTYKQAQSEVAALRTNLANESSRLAEDLRKEISQQRGSMLQMRRKHAELAALKDAVDSAQRALDDTTQKATQTKMTSQATQTNISVVRVAVPPRAPTTPNALFNFALASVVGLALAVGFALWREVVCRFVRGADDIRDLLGVQVLGSLHGGPRISSSRARLPREISPLLTAPP